MSMKTVVPFVIIYQGDGSATSETVSLLTAPVFFVIGVNTSLTFSLSSSFPTGLNSVVSSDSQVVTATLNTLLKTLKIDWPIAVPNGVEVTISGNFEF